MISQTYNRFWNWGGAKPAGAVRAPERKPARMPVFIQDAVLPWQGETLLLSILRAQALGKIDQDQP